MNKTFLWLLIVVILFCAKLVKNVERSEEEPKMGGWQQLQDEASYSKPLAFLKQQVSLSPGSILIKVEMQVVAGYNYKFTFKNENKVNYVVVWETLDGTYQITSEEL